ncbi:hypothetical protein EVAR_19613_1 [Eumeta japonica]|uniref:Uncharacterized protein n=1 Tax=Eumeta variegata TaxID=151549 RepID=A0A4C1UFB7_EUMVA|nr:hypothetical protein EVAR_19613_1 [Eumeta japonica]
MERRHPPNLGTLLDQSSRRYSARICVRGGRRGHITHKCLVSQIDASGEVAARRHTAISYIMFVAKRRPYNKQSSPKQAPARGGAGRGRRSAPALININ